MGVLTVRQDETPPQHERSRSRSVTRIVKDDGEIVMEVEGQLTDVTSEMEDTEHDSSSDMEEGRPESDQEASASPGVNNNATIYCEDTDSQREEDSSQELTIEAEKEDFSDTMMEKMARFMHKKGLIFAPVPVVSVMKEQVPGRCQTKE